MLSHPCDTHRPLFGEVERRILAPENADIPTDELLDMLIGNLGPEVHSP